MVITWCAWMEPLLLVVMLQWQVCDTGCTLLLQHEACSCRQCGLPVQVVYESQPRPDISLYLAPLGGQAADAVMTLNAQAGKSNNLNDKCTCIQKWCVMCNPA